MQEVPTNRPVREPARDGDFAPDRRPESGGASARQLITDYHAKYLAHELTKRCASDSMEKLASVLADAQVDLNPYQVDAALFAFRSPFSKDDRGGPPSVAEVGRAEAAPLGNPPCQSAKAVEPRPSKASRMESSLSV
jgi:hypothetical protein